MAQLQNNQNNSGIDDGKVAFTLTASMGEGGGYVPMIAYALENHPNDSRVRLCDDGIVQSLTSRMGTGGGNTPMVLVEEKRDDR